MLSTEQKPVTTPLVSTASTGSLLLLLLSRGKIKVWLVERARMVSSRVSGIIVVVMEEEAAVVMSCECCGLEEECTGEYVGGVRAYFGGRWLCGLCSEAVKYEAGRRCAGDVEGAVRAHTAFCRTLRRGGPAERVAEGMCQMLRARTTSGRHRTTLSSSSSPRTPAARHHRASPPLSMGL